MPLGDPSPKRRSKIDILSIFCCANFRENEVLKKPSWFARKYRSLFDEGSPPGTLVLIKNEPSLSSFPPSRRASSCTLPLADGRNPSRERRVRRACEWVRPFQRTLPRRPSR